MGSSDGSRRGSLCSSVTAAGVKAEDMAWMLEGGWEQVDVLLGTAGRVSVWAPWKPT